MEKFKQYLYRLVALCLLSIFFNQAYADDEVFTEAQQQKFIQDYALKYHLPASFIKDSLAKADFIQSTYDTQVAIFNAPKHYKGKTWAKYKGQFLNAPMLNRGQAFMCSHQETLEKAQAKYGVPPSAILGIIGVETSYGGFTGHYRVLDTLATLAFNSPRRIDFWQDELAQYLLMCYQYKLDPEALRGAIDGGFGLGQFMPSAYINYAVSATDGDAPNLMNPDDAIMSVANYLKQHGWKSGQQVIVSVKRTKNTCKTLNCGKKELSYTVKVWQKNGVQIPKPPKGDTMADLVILTDSYSPQAFLAYNNYYTFFSYNHSQKYAMAVYLLGITVADEGC